MSAGSDRRPFLPDSIGAGITKKRTSAITLESVLVFLLGVGLYFHFRVGVRISASEFCVPIILFLFFGRAIHTINALKEIRWLIYLFILFAIGVYISDYDKTFDVLESYKSISRPAFVLAYAITFSLLIGDSLQRTCLAFWLGMTVGAFFHLAFNTANDTFLYQFDPEGYAFFVFRIQPALFGSSILLAALLLRGESTKVFGWIVLITCSFVTLRFSARSFAGCIILASILIGWANSKYIRVLLGTKRPITSSILLAAAFVATLTTSYLVYTTLAAEGYLGEFQRQKYVSQTKSESTGIIELLLSGRTEVYAYLLMIQDNPILGHGSLAYPGIYFIDAMSAVGRGSELSSMKTFISGQSGGGHSIMLAAWAYNGIMTFPFWLLVLYLILRGSFISIINGDACCVYTMLIFSIFLWDLLFSPLSVQMRGEVGFLTAVSVYINSFYKNNLLVSLQK